MFGMANLSACRQTLEAQGSDPDWGSISATAAPSERVTIGCLMERVKGSQPGMLANCGTSSGFAHLRRRLVNISSTGSIPSRLSRLPSMTKVVPGKASRLHL